MMASTTVYPTPKVRKPSLTINPSAASAQLTSPSTPSNSVSLPDLHSKSISMETIVTELQSSPNRLEELKRVNGFGGVTVLLAHILHSHSDICHHLINIGANVNAADMRGCSSLHYAVGSESIELLHRLIDAGANLNAQSKAGHTALHLACQLNRIEAAEELVKRGINISIKDVSKREALSYLKGTKAAERPKLLRLAVSRSAAASASAGNSRTHTPTHAGSSGGAGGSPEGTGGLVPTRRPTTITLLPRPISALSEADTVDSTETARAFTFKGDADPTSPPTQAPTSPAQHKGNDYNNTSSRGRSRSTRGSSSVADDAPGPAVDAAVSQLDDVVNAMAPSSSPLVLSRNKHSNHNNSHGSSSSSSSSSSSKKMEIDVRSNAHSHRSHTPPQSPNRKLKHVTHAIGLASDEDGKTRLGQAQGQGHGHGHGHVQGQVVEVLHAVIEERDAARAECVELRTLTRTMQEQLVCATMERDELRQQLELLNHLFAKQFE